MPELNRRNVWSFLQRVDTRGPESQIDLSEVSFIHPFATVVLGLFLRYWNGRGVTFRVDPPGEPQVREHLMSVRFFERFNADLSAKMLKDLVRIDAAASLDEIIDIANEPEIGETVAGNLYELVCRNCPDMPAEPLAVIAGELADNFAVHSEEEFGVLTVHYSPSRRMVTLVIGDCGCGLRRSLSCNPEYAYIADSSDCDAIKLAFLPNVSRRGEGGMGLAETLEAVGDLEGRLYVASGSWEMEARRTEQRLQAKALDFPGVQLMIDFWEAAR